MTHRVLVTGGAGFVGSAVVRMLLDKGFEVDIIDAFYKGHAANLPNDPRVTLFESDLTDSEQVARVLQRDPQSVIHLAAHHFIPFCIENPAETVRSNVLGTETLLEKLTAANVRKLIFASTAAVYAPNDEPCREEDEVAPIDIYGISKQMGEQLVEFHCRQLGLPYALARLFNVIGPRETNPHLLPDIIEQLDDDTLELGNLVPRRDYIYVDDVAAGLVALMDVNLPSGPFNVGCGTAYTATEIVDAIGRALGRKLQVNSVPERQRAGDRPVLQSDCSRLKELGWAPQFTLDEGIECILRHYGKL